MMFNIVATTYTSINIKNSCKRTKLGKKSLELNVTRYCIKFNLVVNSYGMIAILVHNFDIRYNAYK